MRESRQSGSVEGVMSNHDPYSDFLRAALRGRGTVNRAGYALLTECDEEWMSGKVYLTQKG